MLEAMRNASKTWVARILLFILAISFGVFWGIGDVFTGYRSNALVTVGKFEVTTQQYEREYRDALQRISRQTKVNISPDEAHKQGIDREVLNWLTDQASLDAQAQRLHLFVSPQVVIDNAETRPEFKDDKGVFSPAVFAQRLQSAGMTNQGYIAMESRNSQHGAITTAVDSGFIPPRTLLEAIATYNNEERDAKYITLTMTPADVPVPDEAALQKQYDATPQAYTAPEYRSIAIMKVEPADLAPRITVSEDDLKAVYDKDKAQFSVPEKRTYKQLSYPSLDAANQAAQQLAIGMDFEILVKQNNVTDADITFTQKSQKQILDPVVAEAVFSLQEGATSQPISGKLVTAIVKLDKIVPAEQKTFDEVKEQLRQKIQEQRAQDESQSLIDAIENARNNKTQTFEEIAKAQGIPFVVTPPVSPNGFDQDNKNVEMPSKPFLLEAAFKSDSGVENDVLPVKDSYYWYEVREVIPSALSPLDKVRAQVSQDVVANEIREALTKRAEAVTAELKAGKTLDSLAQDSKTEVKTINGISRANPNLAFDRGAVEALFNADDNGYAWALSNDGKSALIMQAQPVLAAPFDPQTATNKSIAQNLTATLGDDLDVTYLAALKKNIGVVVNEVIWGEVTGTLPARP